MTATRTHTRKRSRSRDNVKTASGNPGAPRPGQSAGKTKRVMFVYTRQPLGYNIGTEDIPAPVLFNTREEAEDYACRDLVELLIDEAACASVAHLLNGRHATCLKDYDWLCSRIESKHWLRSNGISTHAWEIHELKTTPIDLDNRWELLAMTDTPGWTTVDLHRAQPDTSESAFCDL